MRHQAIYDYAEICAQHGIRHAVICPGSRSAPLVLGFANHRQISSHVISDERSAGYIALGIAQSTGEAVALVCTSGTAALQFSAAVAEAFYQQIPLIVLTADRPPEWVDQRDGQTIRQSNIYGAHVKRAFNVDTDAETLDGWYANRCLNEAILEANASPKGPVHLNLPFREPLYPSADAKISYGKPRVIRSTNAAPSLPVPVWKSLRQRIKAFRRILLVAGQPVSVNPLQQIKGIQPEKSHLPVVAEILSNLHGTKGLIQHVDLILRDLSPKSTKQLAPDLLLTWGAGVISKPLKQFLRNHRPAEHWHLQEAGSAADTFMNLTEIIRVNPGQLPILLEGFKASGTQKGYFESWQMLESEANLSKKKWLAAHNGEAGLVAALLKRLPNGCTLHLANSMSVRYATLAGLESKQRGVRVFSNRGTSGIDGCTSTAVGHAITTPGPHILITGDVAFFYDRNAFWNNIRIPNLHILVLNNHGGQIFGMIDGPRERKESADFFIGKQKLDTEAICKEYGLRRITLHAGEDFDKSLNEFLTFRGKPVVFEFFSDPEADQKQWQDFKKITHTNTKS